LIKKAAAKKRTDEVKNFPSEFKFGTYGIAPLGNHLAFAAEFEKRWRRDEESFH
jgi:hypothetical protein